MQRTEFWNYRKKLYSAMGIIAVFMIFHIEIGIATKYAPESVLLQVHTSEGALELNAQCFADIVSDTIHEQKKPLTALQSLNDYIDSASFIVNAERGFHLLETGFENYQGEFEIRIVCYSEGLQGVSHTIVNNENQKNCSVKDDGKIVVC